MTVGTAATSFRSSFRQSCGPFGSLTFTALVLAIVAHGRAFACEADRIPLFGTLLHKCAEVEYPGPLTQLTDHGAKLKEACRAFRSNDFAGAIKLFTREIAVRPGDLEWYAYRGAVNEYTASWIRRAQDQARTPDASVQIANHEQDAIKDYDAAIRIDPSISSLYIARAEALMRRGQDRKALDDYKTAIDLEPDKASSYVGRACLLMRATQASRGMTDLEKALELTPSLFDNSYRWHIILARAKLHEAMGNRAAAIADYRRVPVMSPAYSESVTAAQRLEARN